MLTAQLQDAERRWCWLRSYNKTRNEDDVDCAATRRGMKMLIAQLQDAGWRLCWLRSDNKTRNKDIVDCAATRRGMKMLTAQLQQDAKWICWLRSYNKTRNKYSVDCAATRRGMKMLTAQLQQFAEWRCWLRNWSASLAKLCAEHVRGTLRLTSKYHSFGWMVLDIWTDFRKSLKENVNFPYKVYQATPSSSQRVSASDGRPTKPFTEGSSTSKTPKVKSLL
jgi:soluble cytochrome b562